MKHFNLFILLSLFLVSCNTTQTKNSSTAEAKQDTIVTETGLKFWYIKHGTGTKVLPGAEVATYLNLQVNDSTVWNTNDLKDSAFTFIADNTPLIEGFNEVMRYLREGDEIVAILPHNIAYGESGSGEVVPPFATLVYDKFKVLKVGEPKLSMADTLFHEIITNGTSNLAIRHKTIAQDSINYLTDSDQWKKLWSLLNKAEKHDEAIEMLQYCGIESGRMKFYRINSLYAKGEVDVAISELEKLMQEDSVYANYNRAKVLLDKMKNN